MRIILTLILLFFSGCGYETVASNVDQRAANEIVAVLGESGIVSRTEAGRGRGGKYNVVVREEWYTLAVKVLHKAGLPRKEEQTFAELLEPNGLIPNSREVEALRLDHALALEVEQKLLGLPGVLNAKVLLRSTLINPDQSASASVFVEQHPQVSVDRDQVARTLRLLVPGLTDDRLQVEVAPGQVGIPKISDSGVENQEGAVIYRPLVPFLKFMSVPQDQYNRMAGILVGLFAITSIIGLFLGYVLGRRSEAAKNAEGFALPRLARGEGVPSVALGIEQRRMGSDRDLLEG